jgi:UDP-N-acetylmuramate--alanine ligase
MLPIDPLKGGRFHYAGVGGSGMSALAQFQAMSGGHASGSDRGFDREERPDAKEQLERLGVTIFRQDGSGPAGEDCAALVVSTAVEETVPDVVVARDRKLPIVHRSEMLAHFVAAQRTIAVSGTSGKSTVSAMTFEILRGAGRDPSVITGGDLELLRAEGLWGNAWRGGSDLLVVEADESDGSLVRYDPALGVVLNLQKDHKPQDEVLVMFETFVGRTREAVVIGDGENLAPLAAQARARGLRCVTFGFGEAAEVRAAEDALELGADGSAFTALDTRFTLPVPGRHNVENALAAIAACSVLGVDPSAMVEPLARFKGVGRRFQRIGAPGGIEVIDDFAHNPAKLSAAIRTARRRAEGRAPGGKDGRVIAVYQPHGFGPTRFLREDFVETFANELHGADRLWLLEIFYAGGTATRDFSAADIAIQVRNRGGNAAFAPSRAKLVDAVAAEAKPGDVVIVMGARDPSLTGVARAIVHAIEARGAAPDPRAAGRTR